MPGGEIGLWPGGRAREIGVLPGGGGRAREIESERGGGVARESEALPGGCVRETSGYRGRVVCGIARIFTRVCGLRVRRPQKGKQRMCAQLLPGRQPVRLLEVVHPLEELVQITGTLRTQQLRIPNMQNIHTLVMSRG